MMVKIQVKLCFIIHLILNAYQQQALSTGTVCVCSGSSLVFYSFGRTTAKQTDFPDEICWLNALTNLGNLIK